MHLVKVGTRYINLDDVSNITTCSGMVHVYYSGHPIDDYDALSGDEAAAFVHYLDTIACDVLEAEAIAESAKAPTHAALISAGLLPFSDAEGEL